MSDVGEYLRTHAIDVFLVVALAGGVFACGFGVANWNNYIRPDPPVVSPRMSQQDVDAAFANYNQRLADVGRDATIPWVYAIPTTFAGAALAIAALAVLIGRNG